MSLTDTVKVSISSPDRFYIGGDWVKPSSPDEIDVINASTEDVFFRVAEAKAEDMDRAIAAAREAFDHGPWPRMSHAERAELPGEDRRRARGACARNRPDLVRPDGRVEHHRARRAVRDTGGPGATTPDWPRTSRSRSGTRPPREETSASW